MTPTGVELAVKAAICAALLAIFGWVCFSAGESHVQAKWDKVTSTANAAKVTAITGRIQSNGLQAATQAAINADIKKEYTDEDAQNATAGARYDAHSLRLPATVCPGRGPAPAAQTASASRSDATAAGAGPLPPSVGGDVIRQADTIDIPDPIAARLRADADEADRIVASCRAAQGFITRNGLAP